MQRHTVCAKEVRPGDRMYVTEHPRSYETVVDVVTKAGQTRIDFFTMAYESYTVRHPDEGVAVWR